MAPCDTKPEQTLAEDDHFDAEKVIASFLVDVGRSSLELPHLTTGQRKTMKRLVDQHPGELRCESYGFGSERRLHLFREGVPALAFGEVEVPPVTRVPLASPPLAFGEVTPLFEKGHGSSEASTAQDCASDAVRVKNTFIDGFVGNDDSSEPVVFRSMPDGAQMAKLTQLAGGTRRSEMASNKRRLDLSAISEGGYNGEPQSPGRSSTSCENVGETGSVSASAEEDSGCGDEAAIGERDVPTLPQGCSVRNTFIHIEADAPDNHRVVQSMPHGMFRQSLQDELAAARRTMPLPPAGMPVTPTFTDTQFPAHPLLPPDLSSFYLHGFPPMDPSMLSPVPPLVPAPVAQLSPAVAGCVAESAAPAEACATFPPGAEVIIDGLLKAPAFNGRQGVVQSLDIQSGRYSVLLSDGQWTKIKGENLRWFAPLPPPPPPFAAPMQVEDLSQQQVLTWMQPNLGDAPTAGLAASTPVLQLKALV